MYIPIGICESISHEWNEEKDEEKKKKLTIKSWFLRFRVERISDSIS